jgi:hypothetical protein
MAMATMQMNEEKNLFIYLKKKMGIIGIKEAMGLKRMKAINPFGACSLRKCIRGGGRSNCLHGRTRWLDVQHR